jgi:hypothetical protein
VSLTRDVAEAARLAEVRIGQHIGQRDPWNDLFSLRFRTLEAVETGQRQSRFLLGMIGQKIGQNIYEIW